MTLFLVLTSCSATVQTRPAIKEELCILPFVLLILPPEPVFERIDENAPTEKKMLVLLNNITKLKAYTEKLKAVIACQTGFYD